VTTEPQSPTREAESPPEQRPAAGGRTKEFLERLGDRASAMSAVLALMAIVLYAILRIAYSIFYSHFGLTPDDLGLNYLDLVVQSAVGVVLLSMAILVFTAIPFLVVAAYRTRLDSKWKEAILVIASCLSVLALVLAFTALSTPAALVIYCIYILLLLPLGVLGFIDGLRGPSRRLWRGAMIAAAVVALALATGYILVRAKDDRSSVYDGDPAGFRLFGFSITTWGAEEATVKWTSDTVAADLKPVANRCLLYFGQSAGTSYFYVADTHQVLRLSTASVLVYTGPEACTQLRATYIAQTIAPTLSSPRGITAACRLNGTGLFLRQGETDLEQRTGRTSCSAAIRFAIRSGLLSLARFETATTRDIAFDYPPLTGEAWGFDGVQPVPVRHVREAHQGLELIFDQTNRIIAVRRRLALVSAG
jgi:hypothetical protein